MISCEPGCQRQEQAVQIVLGIVKRRSPEILLRGVLEAEKELRKEKLKIHNLCSTDHIEAHICLWACLLRLGQLQRLVLEESMHSILLTRSKTNKF